VKKPEITLWSLWEGSTLRGCGALQQLDPLHTEIKSMRTAATRQGKGVAWHLLQFMLDEAKKRHDRRVILETGSYEPFIPARNLYEKFGFTYCEPLAGYTKNSHSVFMTIAL
jgi:putative acetyltransferase